ncbi:hypothetical protein [Selenomonas sp. oral taxon 126]|uniref:hypothetical protein n=1 Tax=Selenomonas sp. oral taxon 126 TaxID=712528 RepID=UPI001C12C91B|nr:hypothetical protein [Selenomonas sp. oral taxon 126]
MKPLNQRTKSEQREITTKGGIESGKARRRKKALRTALKEAVALSMKELHPDLKDGIMRAAGLKDEALTVGDAILGSIVRSACAGDPKMMKILLDTIGESADIRLHEREVKLKEKAVDAGREERAESITFVFERRDTE